MRKIPKVILLIDSSRESGRQLLKGIAKYNHLHGHCNFERKPMYYEYQAYYKKYHQWEKETFTRLKEWHADGIFVNSVNEQQQFDTILSLKLPTIMIGGYNFDKSIPMWHLIRSDSRKIGKMAAEHLLDRGFKQFAYCGFYNISWSDERGESFAKRIAEAGFKTHFYKQPKSKKQRLWENEQSCIVDWIKLLPKPLGLMACNDERGHNVIESCKISGLDVPSEIAIIGVDNDELVCDLSDPPMTSISLNNAKAGYEATRLLHKLIRGEKIAHQEFTVQPKYIVTRQSTDILAIEDRDVAKAVQFIQQHIQDNLQVSNVVDEVAISRRSLERKFRSVLGHSVHDEIKNLHINLFSMMLIETHLSISQIAASLGLPSYENISRYFRQIKGLSPRAYRKKYQIPLINEYQNNH